LADEKKRTANKVQQIGKVNQQQGSLNMHFRVTSYLKFFYIYLFFKVLKS
jgi:hypothetical protein